MNRATYPRHIEPRLRAVPEDAPVVLILGPRQCGKTTLARVVGEAEGYEYIDFDERTAVPADEWISL